MSQSEEIFDRFEKPAESPPTSWATKPIHVNKWSRELRDAQEEIRLLREFVTGRVAYVNRDTYPGFQPGQWSGAREAVAAYSSRFALLNDFRNLVGRFAEEEDLKPSVAEALLLVAYFEIIDAREKLELIRTLSDR